MCAPISLGLSLLAAVLFVLLLGAGDARLEELGAQARRINSQRLQATLEKLSEFGRHPEGRRHAPRFFAGRFGCADLCDEFDEGCRPRDSALIRPGIFSGDAQAQTSFLRSCSART